jgi:hypothetical protein
VLINFIDELPEGGEPVGGSGLRGTGSSKAEVLEEGKLVGGGGLRQSVHSSRGLAWASGS